MRLCNKLQQPEVLAKFHAHTYKNIWIQKLLDTECQLYISYALFVHVRFTWCKMPAMIMSCALMHVSALGRKNSRTLFLATVKFTSQPCCWFPSPPHTPLVSLFSINSSQSLYNPCNNPGERARKTLFFLTLIPIDPVLQWYLFLSQGISANRMLQTQELAPLIYSKASGIQCPPVISHTQQGFFGTACPQSFGTDSTVRDSIFTCGTHWLQRILRKGSLRLTFFFIIILWPARCQIKINVCCFVFIGFD